MWRGAKCLRRGLQLVLVVHAEGERGLADRDGDLALDEVGQQLDLEVGGTHERPLEQPVDLVGDRDARLAVDVVERLEGLADGVDLARVVVHGLIPPLWFSVGGLAFQVHRLKPWVSEVGSGAGGGKMLVSIVPASRRVAPLAGR